MSAEAAFLEAALPDSCRLLGQSLKPFSVGHYMILRRHSSPFVYTGADWTLATFRYHLPFAVYVCSHTYEEAKENIENPRFIAEVWVPWHKTLCRRKLWGPFWRTDPHIPDQLLLTKTKAFMDYVKRGCASPTVHKVPQKRSQSVNGAGNKPGAPPSLTLLNTLTSNGWAPTEVFNCPYGLAQWVYFGAWEREGVVTIEGGGGEQEMEAIRAYAKEHGLKLRKVKR